MQRDIVVGGLLIAASLVVAVVLNRSAGREQRWDLSAAPQIDANEAGETVTQDPAPPASRIEE